MKVLIVEPHGDDAFISCSSALIQEDLDITVLTMSDRDSHNLDSYYDAVKHTVYIDAPDIHYDLRLKYSTHDIHRRYLAGEDLYQKYIQDMNHHLLVEHRQDYESFVNKIKDSIDLLPVDYDLAIIPLGLFHPNHYATWRASRSFILPNIPRIYYVDKPYIEKRYVKEILKCSSYNLYTAPVQEKSIRAEYFKKLYPTEQSLLRYSSETILEWKDIYAIPEEYKDNSLVREFISIVSDMEEGDKYENLVCYVSQV